MTGIIKVVKGELVAIPDKEQKKEDHTLDTILITVIVTLMLLYFLGEV